MKHVIRLVATLSVAAGTVVASGGAAYATPGNGACQVILATGQGHATGPTTTVATVTDTVGGPLLDGTTVASFVPSGTPPVLMLNGTVTFTTAHGTLTVEISGPFNVTNGQFLAGGPVISGTGAFAEATGLVGFAGVENLSQGTFVETIGARICLTT